MYPFNFIFLISDFVVLM